MGKYQRVLSFSNVVMKERIRKRKMKIRRVDFLGQLVGNISSVKSGEVLDVASRMPVGNPGRCTNEGSWGGGTTDMFISITAWLVKPRGITLIISAKKHRTSCGRRDICGRGFESAAACNLQGLCE